MKRIITIFIFAAFLIFTKNGKAQSYTSAAGLHLGWFITGSYKKMVKDNIYLNFYAGFPNDAGNVLVFGTNAEIHKELEGIEDVYYYYGGGGVALAGSGFFIFGIRGTLGLDYKFAEIPVNISVAWSPGFYFGDEYSSGFDARGGGLTVRYVLSEN